MILVVGTGRSGTSVTSRVLQERLGVDMGGPGRKSPSNTLGDYENRDFRNSIDIPFEENNINLREWKYRVRRFAYEKEEPWGIKDPRNAHFLDKLIEVLPEAHIIWCQRDFDETVASWRKWYGGSMTVENIKREIKSRLADIEEALVGKIHLELDFTDRWDEGELAEYLYNFLSYQGQGGLITPG